MGGREFRRQDGRRGKLRILEAGRAASRSTMPCRARMKKGHEVPTSKGSPTAGPSRRKTFLEKEKRESLIWKGDEVFRCQGVRGAG